MCPHRQPLRLNGISTRLVRAVAAALRVRVRVVLRALLAQGAHGPAARRTSPVAGAAGVAAAASRAAAGVALH